MDASEDTAEFRLHIHNVLHDYAVTHCTTNFLAFTENAVLQFLQSLRPAPLTDPFSLVAHPDPYDAFSRMHDLRALQPYDEIPQTTNEARLYLKKWMGSTSGKPKTETVMFEDGDVKPPPDEPLFPVLTRAARLATPKLGNLQLSIFAQTHNDLLMKNQVSYVQVEHIQEPQVSAEQVLRLGLTKRKEDIPALKSLLQHKMLRGDPTHKNRFLDSALLREVSPCSYVSMEDEFLLSFPSVPCQSAQLPAKSSSKPRSLKDQDISRSPIPTEDIDLTLEYLVSVDGWEAFKSSPPSTPEAANDMEDQLYQLFLVSSPNTEPYFVEETEKEQLDMLPMPRLPPRGGSAGVSKHILADKSYEEFIRFAIPGEAELDQAFRFSKRPRLGAVVEVSDIVQDGHAGAEVGSPLRLPGGRNGKENVSPLPHCQRSVLQHPPGDSHTCADSASGRNGREVGSAENLVDRPTAGEDLDHHSVPPFNLEPEMSRHALGIAAFAQLRAKRIQEIIVAAPTSISEIPIPLEAGPRKTPKELIDANTICLPEIIYPPNSIHKYMASLSMIQKSILVRALYSPECLVELAERESLNGVDLILDPFTGVIFIPLFVLPLRCNSYVERISQQSWRFRQLLVVLEAYPESHSKRVRTVRGAVHTLPEPELCAYTLPIIKAIRKLRRDLDIAGGCGSRSSSTKVQYAFADTVDEAALLTRYYGDFVETIDPTQRAVWGDRFWLDLDFVEDDEANLALAGGMNRFSAAITLCMVSLQDLVEMSPMERTEGIGGYIGVQEIEIFNAYLEAHMQVVVSSTSTPTFF